MKEKENRLSIGRINGVEIFAVIDENNQTLVPIRPICEAIGVSFQGQHNKLKEDPLLASTVNLRLMVGADGKNREMVCLPIMYVYGWIFRIDSRNVSEDARESVQKYQKECYDVLYRHFHGRASRLQEFVDIERQLMERRETLQNSLSELMKSVDSVKSEIKDIDKKFSDLKSERLNPTPSLFD